MIQMNIGYIEMLSGPTSHLQKKVSNTLRCSTLKPKCNTLTLKSLYILGEEIWRTFLQPNTGHRFISCSIKQLGVFELNKSYFAKYIIISFKVSLCLL